MDDIDKGKIGKKDEKLVGWDHIRKPKMKNTNYPPMRVKDADVPGTGLPWTYIPPKEERRSFDFDDALAIIYIVVSVVLIILAIKILGYW